MKKAYLSIGSNIGDRMYYLNAAIKELQNQDEIIVLNSSSVYETSAWGVQDQDDFLNIVLEINTSLSANKLLKTCLGIEKNFDRKRVTHWGPRTIDIDILWYNNELIEKPDLKIPHPFISERAFVTIPWSELVDEIEILGKNLSTIASVHKKLKDKCEKRNEKVIIE